MEGRRLEEEDLWNPQENREGCHECSAEELGIGSGGTEREELFGQFTWFSGKQGL